MIEEATALKTTGTTTRHGALYGPSKWVHNLLSLKGGKTTLPRCCLHDHELHHISCSLPQIVGAHVVPPYTFEGL